MVKGIQREMVMVRTAESELFELAYFILRSDAQKKCGAKSIISEANSIVSAVCADGVCNKGEKRRRRRSELLWFLAGVLLGALALFVICAICGAF